MKRVVKIVLLLAGVLAGSSSRAQDSDKEYQCFFEIGKPSPDFTFSNVANYKSKTVSIKDFRGKWLVLDFWNSGCHACIASFPSTNLEQQQFKNNIQFLLIGNILPTEEIKGNVHYKETEAFFSRLQKRLGLRLPCAFDSTLCNQVIELEHGMPFVVAIDPDGIVRGSGFSLQNIHADPALLTFNNRPALRDQYRDQYQQEKKQYKYDATKPFLIGGNGGPDSAFLFRSLLTKWSRDFRLQGYSDFIHNKRIDSVNKVKGRFELGNATIFELYERAYFGNKHSKNYSKICFDPNLNGKYWPYPIWEIRDPTPLKLKYAYSMIVPAEKADTNYMMCFMQRDLANYFGYDVRVELRKMPYWRLVASDKARKTIATKGGLAQMNFTPSEFYGVNIINYSVNNSILQILRGVFLEPKGMPVIDETMIKGNIDISLRYDFHDIASIQKALREYGLDLIKGEKDMKVLVVKDKPVTTSAMGTHFFDSQ